MCLIIYGGEQQKFSSYFEQLYRLRHQIFIQQRLWSLPSRNGREIDQYDTDNAIYFISLADDGSIESSVRMTPTMQSSLLADFFPHLNERGGASRSPHIYEATRYIVQPARKTREALREAKVKLIVPLLEWCLEQRLTHLQAVIDFGALGSFVEMTLQTEVLGLSHPYGGGRGALGGGDCIAFRWPITEEVLDDVKVYGNLDDRPQADAHEGAGITMH